MLQALACAMMTGIGSCAARATARPTNLRDGPIELDGDWGHMIPDSAHAVLERMRLACLDGIRLVSDDQPERLRVTEHVSGPPFVWLHYDDARVGWINVAVGERDWSRLAYQFGHELGHVTANSWRSNARPAPPCQWLEEALVEAFSLHGLGRLADGWSRDPPFPNDNTFGSAIAVYRQNIVERYGLLAQAQGHHDNPAAWFAANRRRLEAEIGLTPFAQAACATILTAFERDPTSIEALGALNLWAGRSSLPIERYIAAWELSCTRLGGSMTLPRWLRATFAIG